MAKAKSSKKAGQNAGTAKIYINEARYEVNKARRLFRHLRRFPTDMRALARLKQFSSVVVQKARAFFTRPVMEW